MWLSEWKPNAPAALRKLLDVESDENWINVYVTYGNLHLLRHDSTMLSQFKNAVFLFCSLHNVAFWLNIGEKSLRIANRLLNCYVLYFQILLIPFSEFKTKIANDIKSSFP